MAPNDLKVDFLHKEYPKQFDKTEFWKQIKRTVNGNPVSENDINMIVDQIVLRLDLQPSDHVLDLGCGNAALASRFFDRIDRYTGVDFSEYLLQVAGEHFQPHDRVEYREADIRDVKRYTPIPTINKVLVYGCIAYLAKSETRLLLQQLKPQIGRLQRIMIGNVPNLEHASEFFAARNIQNYELDNPASPIGVWWSEAEMRQLGTDLGYKPTTHSMPSDFYGSKYRFDLVLEA